MAEGGPHDAYRGSHAAAKGGGGGVKRGEAGSPLVPLPPGASLSPCRAGVWERAVGGGERDRGGRPVWEREHQFPTAGRRGTCVGGTASSPTMSSAQRVPSPVPQPLAPTADQQPALLLTMASDGSGAFPPRLQSCVRHWRAGETTKKKTKEKKKREKGATVYVSHRRPPTLRGLVGVFTCRLWRLGVGYQIRGPKRLPGGLLPLVALRLHHRAAPHLKAWTGTPAGCQVVSEQVSNYSTLE